MDSSIENLTWTVPFSIHLWTEITNYVKVKCLSKVELEIFDAIDFCPGGCGTPREQILTVPFSRREASGLASLTVFLTVPAFEYEAFVF